MMTFKEWLEKEYYEGFDPSGLSEKEYWELEDRYYEYTRLFDKPVENV